MAHVSETGSVPAWLPSGAPALGAACQHTPIAHAAAAAPAPEVTHWTRIFYCDVLAPEQERSDASARRERVRTSVILAAFAAVLIVVQLALTVTLAVVLAALRGPDESAPERHAMAAPPRGAESSAGGTHGAR